jgi:GR25 family glycosyltransferase involved in LPS biosynthesis
MSKMLVTIAYGNYWERYGKRFESMCDALEEKPDRLVIITDKPIDTKYENIVYIPESGLNNYSIGAYRQKALEICDCDWFIQIDVDDIMYPNYISDLNDDVDWHIFLLKNNESMISGLKNSIDNFYNTDYLPYGGLLNSAIKTNVLMQAGGYKTSYGWEDIILACDLFNNDAKYVIDFTLRGERLLDNEGSITKAPTEIRQRKSDETKAYHHGLKMINRKQEIEHLYRLILDREADEGGLNHYVNSKCSLADIQMQMSRSEEFLNKFKITELPQEELNNDLPILIINLARRVDRKQKLTHNLNLMKIKNYTFIEAVDGKTLQNNTSSEYYNKEKATETKRELMPNEIACALSHLKIFRKMVDENIPYAVVMEDDCIPNINLHNFIRHFDPSKVNTELVLLGYWSSNQWHNGKAKLRTVPIVCKEQQSVTYLEKPNQYVGDIGLCKPHYPSMTLDYVSGTTCGLYSLEMAKKILNMNYPVYIESDNVWNFLPLDKIHLAYPLCAFTEFNDSDLVNTRPLANSNNHKLFSNSFIERINHADFGT